MKPSLTCTVVVVNYNGKDVVLDCLAGLTTQTYPAELFDVLVIDNDSKDGSVEAIIASHPEVQVIRNKDNTGFSPAVNQGARASSADVVALINPDAIADPDWLLELLAPLHRDPEVACTAGLVLDEHGKKIDYGGGEASFYGHGFQAHQGEPADTTILREGPTLFATGASLAARRDVFLESGGLDEEFFAYFEDVDFGWRLWVLGHKVWFAPASTCRHIGHTTVKRFPPERWRYLLERNALALIYKNYGDQMLARALPGAIMLTVARGLVVDDGSDLGDYRIKAEYAGKPAPTPQLTSGAGAHLAAIRDFTLWLDSLNEKRDFIQRNRRRRDDDILTLFRKGLVPNHPDPAFLAAFAQVAKTFNLPFSANPRQRVVIATGDRLGEKMAGPAIRAYEMAKHLAPDHDVRLVSTQSPELKGTAGKGGRHRPGKADFDVGHLTSLTWRAYADWADILVVQGSVLTRFPDLARGDTYVAVDAYDPFQLEGLVRASSELDDGQSADRASLEAKLAADRLNRADVVLCASDRQRQWLLGQLVALGRIDPAMVRKDPALSSFVRVVPFGLPDEAFEPKRSRLREAFPSIAQDDIVLVWGGGIYEWFDPATLVRGVAKAAAADPRVKLVFLGTRHPNATVPTSSRVAEAQAVARELGVLDKHVFLHDGWVPYDERAEWLGDATIGTSTHLRSIETELAYRTRMLDYFWAGLPVICTAGDAIAEEVRLAGLGEVVPEGDANAVAAAIAKLSDPAYRAGVVERVREHAAQRTWSQVLAPVFEFVDAPELVSVRSRDNYLRPEGSKARSGMFRERSPGQLATTFVGWARDKGVKDAFSAGVNSLRVRRAASKIEQG